MSDFVAGAEGSIELLREPNNSHAAVSTTNSRLYWIVACNILISSGAAYGSGLLIFDEVHWYRIDRYDGFVWGWIVTQTFSVALYVSLFRINTIATSIRAFLILGQLALGLTLAAVGFLSVDAIQSKERLLPIISISGGYLIAVFIFLVAMFLQFRFALVCLNLLRSTLPITPVSAASQRELESPRRFTMADAFAFTGLVAVCITAFRLTRDSMTESDTIQLLGLFYAAAIIAICVYAVLQLRFSLTIKTLLCVCIATVFAILDYRLMWYFRSPLRLQFSSMPLTFLWTSLIVCATVVQTRVAEILAASKE